MADFKQAIAWLKEGKKVRRSSWENKAVYLTEEKNNQGKISGRDAGYSAWIVNSIENFQATDWEIYEEGYYQCPKCMLLLDEEIMGKRCPGCEDWTYTKDCYHKGIAPPISIPNLLKRVEAVLLSPLEGHLVEGTDLTREQTISRLRTAFNKLMQEFT